MNITQQHTHFTTSVLLICQTSTLMFLRTDFTLLLLSQSQEELLKQFFTRCLTLFALSLHQFSHSPVMRFGRLCLTILQEMLSHRSLMTFHRATILTLMKNLLQSGIRFTKSEPMFKRLLNLLVTKRLSASHLKQRLFFTQTATLQTSSMQKSKHCLKSSSLLLLKLQTARVL